MQDHPILLCLQAHPLLQVVFCTPEPIDIPGVECVTYELEDLGVDNMAQILTSIAPQVLLHSAHACRLHLLPGFHCLVLLTSSVRRLQLSEPLIAWLCLQALTSLLVVTQ